MADAISQKLIIQTDMYHIDQLNDEYEYDYYYAIDTGRLFKVVKGDELEDFKPIICALNNAHSSYDSNLIIGDYYYNESNNIIYKYLGEEEETPLFAQVNAMLSEENAFITASDYDRRFSVEKTIGKKYYCVDTNQLWLYKGADEWEYVAGNLSIEYQDTGFFDGNLTFIKQAIFHTENYHVWIKATKIGNVVLCGVTKTDFEEEEENFIIVRGLADFEPSENLTITIEKDADTSLPADIIRIETTPGNFSITFDDIKQLTTDCKFWYITE